MATKTVSLDFTDGDTFKRVTITDPDVGPADYPFCQIDKRSVEDVDDAGWFYGVNVAKVNAGSFDVNVAASSWNEDPQADEYPNEVVTLVYIVR